MAIQRSKRLKYRSLHYKEWLIGMNVFKDMYTNIFWNVFSLEDKRGFFTITDFQTLIACKVIQDTFGYFSNRTMATVLDLAMPSAERRILRMISLGYALPSVEKRKGRTKIFYLTKEGQNFLTNEYPKRWTVEHRRLLALELRFPSIRIEESIRQKSDAHGPKSE